MQAARGRLTVLFAFAHRAVTADEGPSMAMIDAALLPAAGCICTGGN